MTIGPGSVLPSSVSVFVAAHTPTANTATIAASSRMGRSIQRTSAYNASAANDPAVPGAIGKKPT